jgi:methyl-accepting chemotaxis protein
VRLPTVFQELPVNIWKNISIGRRLSLGFGAVLLILAGVAALGASSVSNIQSHLREIAQVNNQEGRYATEMREHVEQIGASVRDIVLLTDVAEMRPVYDRVKVESAAYDAAEAKLSSMFSNNDETAPEERAIFAKIAEQKAVAWPALTKVIALGLDNKDEDATKAFITGAKAVQTRWLEALTQLAELEESQNQDAAKEAESSYAKTLMLLISLSFLGVAVGSVTAWVLTKSVTTPIARAVEIAKRVASGDLTSVIDASAGDETGRLLQALKDMNGSLATLVRTVRNSSDSIATGSTQIAAGNADLSQRTEEQAGNLQETSASMEQLSSTVKNNSATAQKASAMAVSASEVAVRGGSIVSAVVSTMDEINTSSRRIAEIIGVIDGIAFQTNILALNAAVEAARAGEQGRGFAVVASEVRGLAQRSADAAKSIKGLIGSSVDKVEAGTRLVSEAGKAMDEIVSHVRKVTEMISEISASTIEQTTGIGHVADAVTQLDQVTQQNAALVEESATAAESLKHQADQLAQVVSVFKLSRDAGMQREVSTATGDAGVGVSLAPRATLPAAVAQVKAKSVAISTCRVEPSHAASLAIVGSSNDWETF